MTYAAQANKFGKHAVQIVELYLDYCSLTFGVAPCGATLGEKPCYNTRNTCRSSTTYNGGEEANKKIYRFSSVRIDGIQEPGDAPTFPVLLGVDTSPTVLTPGKGLGVRSTVSISLADFPWTDSGIDPYLFSRLEAAGAVTYDDLGVFYNDMIAIYNDTSDAPTLPSNIGSFWGKFLVRNKYYQNRRIDVLTGFLDDNGKYQEANFKRRTYIITNMVGPNPDGRIVLEGSDPLKFADGEKAKFPLASTSKLETTINDSVTTFNVLDPDDIYTVWNTAGQIYIRVNDEIMRKTSISGLGTGTVAFTVQRSQIPDFYDVNKNIRAAHDAGATVQMCWLFDDVMVYDIVYYLLHDIAGIPASYLEYSVWKAGIDANFPDYRFSTLLTDPIAVKDLITEMTELSVLIWWHEREQVVKLKGLRFEETHTAEINDDDSIIAESISATEDPKALLTQFWLFYSISWPLANPKLLSSFRIVDVQADLDKELPEFYGKSSIREVRSRWLNNTSTGLVAEIGATMIKQYSDVRKVITFTLDPKDDDYWVGDTVGVSTKYIQDEDGNPLPKNYLITQSVEKFNGAGVVIAHTAMELFSYARTGYISPDTVSQPFDIATSTDKNQYAYICYDPIGDNPAVFLDGSPAYEIV